MIDEFETGLEIKNRRDFFRKIKTAFKYAIKTKDLTMVQYLEELAIKYYINQNNREERNRYIDETIPILDEVLEKYKNLNKNRDEFK